MDVIYRYDPFEPMVHKTVANADEAMAWLAHGHDRYATIVAQLHREMMGGPAHQQIIIQSNRLSIGLPLVAGTAAAQTPFALVLGCSDARAPVELIFDQSPNDVFVVRVAGNVLGVECLGSIDYAVANLGKSLKLVVVLGHTTCGAVSAAVDSYLAPKTMHRSPSLTPCGRWSIGSRRQCGERRPRSSASVERLSSAAAQVS